MDAVKRASSIDSGWRAGLRDLVGGNALIALGAITSGSWIARAFATAEIMPADTDAPDVVFDLLGLFWIAFGLAKIVRALAQR